MFELYQHLPDYVSPVIFSFFGITVRWYAILYIAGFFTVHALLLWRIKKKEGVYSRQQIIDLLMVCFFGAVIGARIGYVFLYNWEYFSRHLLEIFFPYNFALGMWTGFYGMSYHGALLGILLSSWAYARLYRFSFLRLADFVSPAVGMGYFFGRIGNFMNGELYGRTTNSVAGMYFDGFLRYPSQLMEAFLEGIVIFSILWTIRNKRFFDGGIFCLYGLLYASIRFIAEFFREPDVQIGFLLMHLTQGQILSICMFNAFSVCMVWFWLKKRSIL